MLWSVLSFNFFVRFSYVVVLLTSQGHRRNLLVYVISWKLYLSWNARWPVSYSNWDCWAVPVSRVEPELLAAVWTGEDFLKLPVTFLFCSLTLSRSFSFSLSMDLFSPSSSRSISLTVSPERVLNFFLWRKRQKLGLQTTCRGTSNGVAAVSHPQPEPAEVPLPVSNNYHDSKLLDYFCSPRGDTFCTIKQIS